MNREIKTKKITKEHRIWLSNIYTTYSGRKSLPFDYVGITEKRIDILYDMGLIELNKDKMLIGTRYVLSEKGKRELIKLK